MKRFYIALVVMMINVCAYSQIDVIATAGTMNASYANIKLAFDAINAGTHQGAITINVVSNGTDAAAPAVLNSGDAAPASYTSVLIRPTNDGVSISSTTLTGRGVIELNGADNVTIDGDNPNTGGVNRNLTLQNLASSTTTFTSVIRSATSTLVNTANNLILKNCIINGSATGRNISSATSTTGTENNTYGILISGGASTVSVTTAPSAIASLTTTMATGQTANNLIIENNEITACAKGIQVAGAVVSVINILTVTKNLIGSSTPGNTTTIYSQGITIQGYTAANVAQNTIQNIEGWVGSSTGSNIIAGIALGTISANGTAAIVEQNLINGVNNRSTGTWPAIGISLQAGNNQIIRNNIISGVTGDMTGGGAFSTSFGLFGIRISAGLNHQIYHNSVSMFGLRVGTANSSLLAVNIAITLSSLTGIDIRNNILSNTMTGGTTSIAYTNLFLPSSATTSMNLTLNNNTYYSGGIAGVHGIAHCGATYTNPVTTAGVGLYKVSDFVFSSTAGVTNFRNYSSALHAAATNDNASYASSNPAPFISEVNPHLDLTSSEIPNVEQKGEILGVTSDFDGETRPNSGTTFPDIGADEVILAGCTGQPDAGVASPVTVIKCSGQTQTFIATGLTTGLGISYQWKVSNISGSGYADVSGGSGGNTSNYTTGALIVGTYYFIIQTNCASSGQSNISNELVLTVNPTPTANAASNSPICGGATLNLTGTTDIGASFAWTGPNSFSSLTQNPSITNVPNNASGTYTFVATLNGCNSSPATTSVSIVGAPVVSMSATPDVICAGENSQLLANVSNFLNLKITEVTLYDQGTGLTTPYPAFIPSTGVQDFVEVSNVSTDPLDVSGIKLFDYPSNSSTSNHTFTFPNGTIIPGNGISVVHLGSGTDSPADLYFNTGGTGNILSSGGLIGIVLKDGTNIIDAVGVNSGYTFNAATGVTASDWSGFAPSASTFAGTIRTAVSDNNNGSDWIQSNNPSPLQTIGTYNGGFTSIPSNVTYLWSPSTFLTATNISNPIAQNVTSSIEYHVTVTNDANCVTLDTVNVTVSGGAVINNDPISISRCEGQSASFNVVAVGPSLTYQWKKNGNDLMDVGNITGSMTPTLNISGVTPPDGDNYTVQVSSSCGSPVLSNPAILTVNPNPVVTMTPTGQQTICAPNSVLLTASPSNESYIWKRNNIIISGANNNTYNANLAGIYKAIVTITATGCKDSTSVLDTIFVNPQPSSPTASATPNEICSGQDINLMSSAFVSGYTMNSSGTEAFIDIEATGTSIASVSDDSEHNITMQPFTYNGVSYNSARIGMNGAVVLGVSSGEITHLNAALPSTAIAAGNIFLAPWWDDLDIRDVAPLTTIHLDTIGSKYIIQFTNVAHNDDLTLNVKFQIQLDNATNKIHFIYPDAEMGDIDYDYGVSGTIGIQYSSTEALQYSTNAASLSNGQCITFTPNSLGYAWTGPNSFSSSMQNPTITSATALANGQYQVVFTNLVSGCTDTAFTTVIVEGSIVKSQANSGGGSLRSVYSCLVEGSTITYDTGLGIDTSFLTAPLTIDKNATIQGNGNVLIDFQGSMANGLLINTAKSLTLDNMNVNGGAGVTSTIENNGTLNLKTSTINGNNDPVVKNNTGAIIEILDSSGTSSIKQN